MSADGRATVGIRPLIVDDHWAMREGMEGRRTEQSPAKRAGRDAYPAKVTDSVRRVLGSIQFHETTPYRPSLIPPVTQARRTRRTMPRGNLFGPSRTPAKPRSH